jgi:uncharacterized membrane protein YcaP (DUF421 family)
MDKEDIRLDDWDRILFGQGTPLYLLEVVVRVAIVYLMILLAMRFLGKRMIAEVGRADVVARVSLAAAVGLPIQRPGRGLLVAAVIVVIIVLVSRYLNWITTKKERFEKSFQGIYSPLVIDGVLDKKRIDDARITREEVFAALRAEDIRHLGQVERLYMEADGKFSLVETEASKPGLCVIPHYDNLMRNRQEQTDCDVCAECGKPWEHSSASCANCGGTDHENAIMVRAEAGNTN